MAVDFLKKQLYIGTLMGDSEIVNMLSGTHFLCHVRGCERLIKLKSFNNLSSITEHWGNHATGTPPDESCKILIKRHNFCKSKNQHHPWQCEMKADDLEELDDGCMSIRKLMRGRLAVRRDMEFNGRYLLLDKDVLNKIVARDPTALSKLPKDSQTKIV